jgi:hypothetical protein
MVRGLALETKMNSFLVCKMNLLRFEMHSKLYIHFLKGKKIPYLFCRINFWNFENLNKCIQNDIYIYIYIYPLLDLEVVGLDDVAPTIIDKESFMRSWYIN